MSAFKEEDRVRPYKPYFIPYFIPYRAISVALAVLALTACRTAVAQNSVSPTHDGNEIVIGTDPTYAPFETRDPHDSSRLQGFDIDLGNAIGAAMGKRVRWLSLEWSGVQAALKTGKCDLAMAGITITPERKKEVGFSRPYYLSGQEVARRKGDLRIQKPTDLLGKTVAVIAKTTGQFAVEKLGVPSSDEHRFDSQPDTLLDLQNGKSDAAVGDLPALKAMLRQGYPDLELVFGVGQPELLGVMARPEDGALVAAVNQAIGKLIADGTYAKIYKQWIQEPATPAILAELDRVSDQGTSTQSSATNIPAGKRGFRWDLFRQALPVLAQGAKLTLKLTGLTLLLGVTLGLLVALCRLSGFVPLQLAATVYVEIVRGTPLLMQIYVIYFVLPSVNISLPSFAAGLAALSLNAAAYISEIFRAGIESIDAGQMEAARALGMDYRMAMRWVILPQTVRRVLPPLTNEAVALLKDSSLVSVVALNDLMRNGKELATDNGHPTEVYLAVALFYLVMTLPLTYLVRRLEVRWQPISRPRERKSRETK